MKNSLFAKVLVTVLILSLTLTCIGCNKENDITGRYVISSMDFMGQTFTGAELDSFLADGQMTREELFIELKADGVGSFSFLGESGTFQYDSTGLWMGEDSSEKLPFTIDGNTLTITSEEGYNMVFTK